MLAFGLHLVLWSSPDVQVFPGMSRSLQLDHRKHICPAEEGKSMGWREASCVKNQVLLLPRIHALFLAPMTGGSQPPLTLGLGDQMTSSAFISP